MNKYHLSIVTPEKTIFDDEVVSLIAPGSLGYLGILARHAPLITGLVAGKLTIRKIDGQEEIMAISGGFLEVSHNRATILADAVQWASDIDISKAQAMVEQARAKLHSTKPKDMDLARKELEEALTLVRVYTEEHSTGKPSK